MTLLQRHEARVKLARKIAKDAFDEYINGSAFSYLNVGYSIILREYLIFALKPFFMSNDIENIKVDKMRDKDYFYPIFNIIIIPKQNIYVDMVIKLEETSMEIEHENNR